MSETSHRLTGARDLAMEFPRYIGTQVTFIRFTKGGLAYVRAHDGKMLSVPRRNLEPRVVEGASNTGEGR